MVFKKKKKKRMSFKKKKRKLTAQNVQKLKPLKIVETLYLKPLGLIIV